MIALSIYYPYILHFQKEYDVTIIKQSLNKCLTKLGIKEWMRKIAKKDSYCRTNKCLTRLSVKDWMGKKKVTPGKRNTITIVWFATTLTNNNNVSTS